MRSLLNQYRDHHRVIYLDRSAFRPWSDRNSVFAALRPEDVSLTYHADARQVWRHQHGRREVVGSDIFAVLADMVAADKGRHDVIWAGYFGYACRPDLPARLAPSAGGATPDAVWLRIEAPITVHHSRSRAATVPRRTAGRGRTSAPSWYVSAFSQVQREMLDGNSYEVNLTFRAHGASPLHPVEIYHRLAQLNPAPYAGYLRHHDVTILSSSPERFARIQGSLIETRPMKGTTARFAEPIQDAASVSLLLNEPRFRSEHLIVVDLLRNDLATMCRPGTVRVPALMDVESYQSVHQLVSTVQGELQPGVGVVEAVRRMFPPGSMTGAPKRRTMSIIAAAEETPRGVYAGTMGWLRPNGDADLAVVIRTLVGSRRNDDWVYQFGTGGGLTVQSNAHEEWSEAQLKAERLLAALAPEHPLGHVPSASAATSRDRQRMTRAEMPLRA